MNQIMLGVTLSLLLMSGVTACAVLDNTAHLSANMRRINLPRCVLGGATIAADCTVKVFDGNALAAAQRDEQGAWFILVSNESVIAPRIAVYSAPGYEPQIQATRLGVRDDEQMVLKAKSDSRGGYLAGVVFKKTDEKMTGGVCGIENFIANKTVIITFGRARFTATTDNIGSFQMGLPGGRYMVNVDGDSRAVDVPEDDTMFVVVPVK